MVDDTLKPQDASTQREPAMQDKRFAEADEHRRIVMGSLKTDEETRLAAEIEKLRGTGE